MKERIKIYLSDWQYNAGVVGLCNILEYARDEINYEKQYVEIDPKVLSGFEEKYFTYFIEKYKETTPWHRIIAYEDSIKAFENGNFKNFSVESLNYLNDYIKMVKDYLSRDNYKKVFPFIKSNKNISSLTKELKTIRIRKNEDVEEKIDEVKERFVTIKEIIDFCNSEDGKKYIAAKGVIYNIINNGWNGVCFLNRRPKEDDVYKDYKEYFVNPVIDYIKTNKEKFKYNCFICDKRIRNLNNHLGFLNSTGFDVGKKPSHIWDYENDVATCDLCRLVYSCLPAGFVYAYNKGIFINNNTAVRDLMRTNKTLRDEVLTKTDGKGRTMTYKALVNSINKQHTTKIYHELQDIQIIRYEEVENQKREYMFNILSKYALKIIRESEFEINSLINTGYNISNTYLSIYDEVLNRILNNHNMFTLIHKLLMYKITESQLIRTYYGIGHVMNLNIVNINYLKGAEGMGKTKENKELIKQAGAYGYYLRKEYLQKDSNADKSKIRGISYRLLNALKTRNGEMFMHNIITSYMYIDKAIPKNLTLALENEEMLGIVGYAFVTGLNGGDRKNNESGGRKNEG